MSGAKVSLESLEKALSSNQINYAKVENYCGIKGLTVLLIYEGKYSKNRRLKKWENLPQFPPVYRVSVDDAGYQGYYKVVSENTTQHLNIKDILVDVKENKHTWELMR